MEKDERLSPLQKTNDLQIPNHDGPVNYSPVYDEDNFDERRSIREYFNVVYKRLPLILALTILITAAAAFYMYRQPSQFMAVMEMVIEPRKPKPQANQPININFGNDVNYYNTQLQLLQNPDLMRDVVTRLALYKDPNLLKNENKGIGLFFRSLFSSEKDAPAKESSLPILNVNSNQTQDAQQVSLSPDEKALVDKYAGILLGGLKVDQREKTNLVTITITSTNAELSAKVANTIADAFIEQDAARETQGAKKAYEELTKSIEELQGTIAGQEVELINYMRSSNLPLQDKGSELRAANLQTLSEQFLTAMDDRRKLEARYNAAVQASNRGEGINISDITDNKVYQDMNRLNIERRNKLQDRLRELDKEIQEAQAEKAELLVKYTPEYPKVKQVEEKIASLTLTRETTKREDTETINRDEQKLKNEAVKGALVGLKSQLDAARTREGQLSGSYMNEISSANIQGQAETQLTTLKRKIETNRGLLDTYTQRQKEQELAISGSRPDNIKPATRAVTPIQPIGPKRERNIFIAFLISLAAGIGLAFLLDYLDDSVKSSDDIGRHLGLPTLALIPHQTVSGRSKLGLVTTKTNGIGGNSTAMIALEDTRSAMAEAYRHLRTSLLFSSAGKPPQTILVTSSQPAEGKTTTAINTAITLAQSGADVVIIDCDLRRPRLHNHFGFGNANGLTNYLSGEKNPDNLLKPFPHLPKLKVITSGPIPPNPAELLSSNEMKNLLQFLKANYKHVIIDSPPAISFTDAAILSTQVDGVVLVAMAGKSSIHLIRRFKQRLSNIGARIYGVVLNGIKSNSVEYGYYGYGYTYYTPDKDDSTPFMEEIETVSSTHKTKS